jgi:hypothetical protein
MERNSLQTLLQRAKTWHPPLCSPKRLNLKKFFRIKLLTIWKAPPMQATTLPSLKSRSSNWQSKFQRRNLSKCNIWKTSWKTWSRIIDSLKMSCSSGKKRATSLKANPSLYRLKSMIWFKKRRTESNTLLVLMNKYNRMLANKRVWRVISGNWIAKSLLSKTQSAN